jgi:hypothetical protein
MLKRTAMKVYNVSLFALIVFLPIGVVTDHIEFFIALIMSLLPVNIKYGNRSITDLQNDKTAFSGVKILIWPPIILFFLILTHNKWAGYIDFYL